MSELHVFTDDTDTIIAHDLADVRAVYGEIGVRLTHFFEDEWERLAADSMVRLWIDTVTGTVGEAHAFGSELRDVSCADLIDRHGRGFLCSTEY